MKSLYVDVVYNQRKKSVLKAYALWLFLGSIGAHKFYIGASRLGWLYVALFVAGVFTAGITWILLLLLIIVDLFTIPSAVGLENKFIRNHISNLADE